MGAFCETSTFPRSNLHMDVCVCDCIGASVYRCDCVGGCVWLIALVCVRVFQPPVTSASESLSFCTFSLTFISNTCSISISIFFILETCSRLSSSIWARGLLHARTHTHTHTHCQEPFFSDVMATSSPGERLGYEPRRQVLWSPMSEGGGWRGGDRGEGHGRRGPIGCEARNPTSQSKSGRATNRGHVSGGLGVGVRYEQRVTRHRCLKYYYIYFFFSK